MSDDCDSLSNEDPPVRVVVLGGPSPDDLEFETCRADSFISTFLQPRSFNATWIFLDMKSVAMAIGERARPELRGTLVVLCDSVNQGAILDVSAAA
jgi:hypothetical protein